MTTTTTMATTAIQQTANFKPSVGFFISLAAIVLGCGIAAAIMLIKKRNGDGDD